jgi:hypothetical protein
MQTAVLAWGHRDRLCHHKRIPESGLQIEVHSKLLAAPVTLGVSQFTALTCSRKRERNTLGNVSSATIKIVEGGISYFLSIPDIEAVFR